MRELSLNVLDIAENSVAAGAKLVVIELDIYESKDRFEITVTDDGCGMDSDFLENAADPFVTTRKTRKIGLGLPFFKYSAESSGGSFEIKSEKGVGTKVKAQYVISSIDRMPLGDIGETVLALVTGSENTDFLFKVKSDSGAGYIDTREIKKILDGMPMQNAEVILFLKNYIKENLSDLYGGLI